MSTSFDAIVVGGGVLGAAIAHALQAAGERVVLLEGAALAAGATGRSGGMIRAFHAEPFMTTLAAESMATWLDFEARIGVPCGFVRTGATYVAPAARRDAVVDTAARLAAAGVRVEVLDAARARARFPGARFADDEVVAFEPDAGYADAPRAARAFADAAARLGADVREGVAAEALVRRAGRVIGVRAGGTELAAPAVVLAAGLGTASLLAGLGLDLGLFAKAIQVNRLAGPVAAHPCFMDLAPRAFGRPVDAHTSWVGVAATGDDLAASPADALTAAALAASRFPGLGRRVVVESRRTADAYTHGAPGLLGPVPGVPGLLVAAGFGGAGFKIAPAVAARVAALVARKEAA